MWIGLGSVESLPIVHAIASDLRSGARRHAAGSNDGGAVGYTGGDGCDAGD